ncbi:MAG: hypothetical protein Q4B16_08195 [Bacteroidia bacterium]|nr:hypothetical protein [Bacteroidia bacterium]
MKVTVQHIRFPLLLLFCALTVLHSCVKQPSSQGGDDSQCGDVVIKISSAPGTRSAKDGDEMVNLRVWMVDGSGTVRQYASLTPNAPEATVTFSDVTRGDYTLYFLANSTALSGYAQGSTIDDTFLKSTLSLSGGSLSPEYADSEGMPLSLKKECSIGPGVNRISAQIVRVCALVNITVKNRSADKALYITSVGLSDRNPSSGYIFAQDDHSSPSSTTYGAFPSTSSMTRIEPSDESKVLSFYLFESCNAADAISLSLNGALYDKDIIVSSVDKKGYHATGNATNTDINTSSWYFLASASSPRQFLYADGSGLALKDVGSDEELFVKSDVTSYLWQFSYHSSDLIINNFGTGKYFKVWLESTSSAKYGMFDTPAYNKTNTSTGRQFYQTYTSYTPVSRTYYSYLYNNSGVIGVTSPSRNTSSTTNTGWYLREATEYTYRGLSPDPEKAINVTTPLTYTDSYGIAQPLTSICRNDRLEVVVNVFYNPVTGTFDFQVESWRTKDNRTTFD